MAKSLDLAVTTLDDFFSKKVQTIPNCNPNTKSYITNIFSKPNEDFSKQSVTLVYAQAVSGYKFDLFQKVGDWLLFAKIMYPKSLNGASPEYYDTLAQCSYYKCYCIVDKQWPLFEELADMFPRFVQHMHQQLLVDSLEAPNLPNGLFQFKLY